MKAVIEVSTSPEKRPVPVRGSRLGEPMVPPEVTGIAGEPTESFIDASEAAAFVKLHPKTLLRLAREGSIPAHPLTGNRRRIWRFLRSELDAWARSRVHSGCDRCQNSRSR
jgi:excisionase family DNA binding protein